MVNPTEEKPKIQLSNKLAQEFMEQKIIVVDGKEINLWTGHSHLNIKIQERWNSIKSFALLNSCSEGTCGSIVLTGIMQIPRQEIAEYAIKLGFRVHSTVSKNTDYLIFGSENVSPTKVAEAIELNLRGANVQFIDEISFLQIISDNYEFIENNNYSVGLSYDQIIIENTNCDNNKEILISKTKSKLNLPIVKESVVTLSNKLDNCNIVISGTFANHSRDEYKTMIERNGGKNVGSVSSKTSFILAGENMGPEKLKKAESLGVKLKDEITFLEMIKSESQHEEEVN